MTPVTRPAFLPLMPWLVLPLFAGGPAMVLAAGGGGDVNEACLGCHAELEERLVFEDGGTRSLRIDRAPWSRSAHGRAVRCRECHGSIDPAVHPRGGIRRKWKSEKDYLRSGEDACHTCHAAYTSRVAESIHARLRESGNAAAPTCRDCHSVHALTNPRIPSAVSARCGSCHGAIEAEYKQSIHGRELGTPGHEDVPVCTDCHTAHSISDPRSTLFHAGISELCAKCHSDPMVMRRNGLDTAAYTTYVEDFHGKSNLLYSREGVGPRKPLASCTDCHGAHNIQSLRKDPAGQHRAETRGRLLKTCRSCHSSVPESFVDAWLSHYPARFETAPVFWGLKRVYGLFNPLMVALFAFNLLLDLWRVSVRGAAGRSI